MSFHFILGLLLGASVLTVCEILDLLIISIPAICLAIKQVNAMEEKTASDKIKKPVSEKTMVKPFNDKEC